MADEPLTAEQILDVAEDVLRRYGASKATVVDVARVLGISHGSVYRHFPSKSALRDAVTERWLARISDPLAAIAAQDTPADDRLREWVDYLVHAKRRLASEDPELFNSYMELAAEAREVIADHVQTLVTQLTAIVAAGVDQGIFRVRDTSLAARAVFDATTRFHNPAHAYQWDDPEIDQAYESVWLLITKGLA